MDNTFIATTFDWDHRTPNGVQRAVNRVLRRLRIPMQVTPQAPNMANVEARMNLFHLLEQTVVSNVPGDIVDLGCNAGDSTIVMQKIISTLAPDKQVHAYDSFKGLPTLTDEDRKDGIYAEGYMKASIDSFKKRFDILRLPSPQIHAGWFQDTIPENLPDTISFAYFDGDLYESTKHLLTNVYDRMPQGAIGMIAVYYDETVFPRQDIKGVFRSPGVKRATDEFFHDKPEKVDVLYANEYSNGYFRKC